MRFFKLYFKCANINAEWQNLQSGDPYVPGGDGTDKAEKIDFCPCAKGDVIGYRFKDHEHDVKFGKNFDPPVRASEVIWKFFQDRQKKYKTRDWK